nr:MAG TPA: hypothetical protein [Caudoviricetes sp.]
MSVFESKKTPTSLRHGCLKGQSEIVSRYQT